MTSNSHRLSLWVYSFQLFSFSPACSSDVSSERLCASVLRFLFLKFPVNANQIEQNIWWTLLRKVSRRESGKSRVNVKVNMLTNTRKKLIFFCFPVWSNLMALKTFLKLHYVHAAALSVSLSLSLCNIAHTSHLHFLHIWPHFTEKYSWAGGAV